MAGNGHLDALDREVEMALFDGSSTFSIPRKGIFSVKGIVNLILGLIVVLLLWYLASYLSFELRGVEAFPAPLEVLAKRVERWKGVERDD